jgi:glycosyltransferase involved in cell wall biosynthesis
MIRYLMVSSEIRRDLEHPLSLFTRIEIHHLYNRGGWGDMSEGDYGPRTRRFSHPMNLYWQIAAVRPQVIQGPEPLSLLMFPYLLAIFLYLMRHPETHLVCMSQETVPLRRKYGLVISALMRPVLRRWFERASVLLWLDQSSRQNMLDLGAPETKMEYLLYGCWGVDLDEFSPAGQVAWLPGGAVILCVSRLVPEKGVDYLIDAFRLLRESGVQCTLAIIGDGAHRQSLEEQARLSGYGSDIVFLGGKKHADLPPYMRRAAVLAIPSTRSRLWVQHLSTTAWHAMACGLPVVASDIGEMRQFTPRGTGVLVPEKDPLALAAALAPILKDTEVQTRMSRAAVEYAQHMFDIKSNVLKAETMILDLIDASSTGEAQGNADMASASFTVS